MKRSCKNEVPATDEPLEDTSGSQNFLLHKRLKLQEDFQEKDEAMDELQQHSSLTAETSVSKMINFFSQPGQHHLVERENNPLGQSLVNSAYVGKKTPGELMELDVNSYNAAQFVRANVNNKVDQIGRQMKFLQDNLEKAVRDAKRDSTLHMAACNFVKKPGHTYHLYERQSGQRYFSMLSPEDWHGNSPHKFLGSWYLESDQSWTPAEERHNRFDGAMFLKTLYGNKSIQ